jgi:membrane protease YdiL (CAAX protease family)
MLSNDIVFSGYILFLIISIPIFIKQNKIYSWPFFISFCIMSPISEECIFRDTLLRYTNPYLNAMLFSSIHLTNMLFLPNWTLKLVLYQLTLTLYIGYYFAIINNVFKSIILHISFNTIIYMSGYLHYNLQS